MENMGELATAIADLSAKISEAVDSAAIAKEGSNDLVAASESLGFDGVTLRVLEVFRQLEEVQQSLTTLVESADAAGNEVRAMAG